MDYVKLERTLVALGAALPEPPQWSAISTIEGEFLRQYPTLVDGDRVTALTNLHVTQVQSMLHDFDDGALNYSISVGSEGTYIVFLLQDKYVLSFDFKALSSIDATLKAIQSNWDRLLSELDL